MSEVSLPSLCRRSALITKRKIDFLVSFDVFVPFSISLVDSKMRRICAPEKPMCVCKILSPFPLPCTEASFFLSAKNLLMINKGFYALVWFGPLFVPKKKK